MMGTVRILFREVVVDGNAERMVILEGQANGSVTTIADEISRGITVRIDNPNILSFENETPSTFYFNGRVNLYHEGRYALLRLSK